MLRLLVTVLRLLVTVLRLLLPVMPRVVGEVVRDVARLPRVPNADWRLLFMPLMPVRPERVAVRVEP